MANKRRKLEVATATALSYGGRQLVVQSPRNSVSGDGDNGGVDDFLDDDDEEEGEEEILDSNMGTPPHIEKKQLLQPVLDEAPLLEGIELIEEVYNEHSEKVGVRLNETEAEQQIEVEAKQ